MKYTTAFLSIFLLIAVSAYSQESVLYHEIQQVKSSGARFENVVLKETNKCEAVLAGFFNPNEVFFFENVSIDFKNKETKSINLLIPMGNKNMVLELTEVPEYFYDYVVTTSCGQNFSANKDIKHYRGVVRGESNSIVAITFYENEIMGLVCTNEGNFNIAKSKSGKHIFYNDNNLKEKMDFISGTEDDPSIEYSIDVLLQERNILHKQKQQEAFQSTINKRVKFYVETYYDMYWMMFNNLSSVEAYITGLFNQVGILYQNEDILTSISEIHIWTSIDPFGNPPLPEFQRIRTSINGHLGILLQYRGPNYGTAAGFNGLCNPSTSQKLAVVWLNRENPLSVPNYSWPVYRVTHELGHLLGSRNTDACAWNGNNTAIEYCGSSTCPGPPNNPIGFTIMSDCWQGNPRINFTLGFGQQPGNVIRNNVRNASCIPNCISLRTVSGTYNSGTHKIDDGITIEVKDATIRSGVTMEIESCGGSVIINPNTVIQSGATFIIR